MLCQRTALELDTVQTLTVATCESPQGYNHFLVSTLALCSSEGSVSFGIVALWLTTPAQSTCNDQQPP